MNTLPRIRSLLALLLLAFAAPLAAQETTVPDSIQQELRSALRALASAQEWYFQEHQAYSTSADSLKASPGCAVPAGVIVSIPFADAASGWAMESRHPAAPGQSCVYWFGKPGAVPEILTEGKQLRGSETPGRVRCDFDPPRPPRAQGSGSSVRENSR